MWPLGSETCFMSKVNKLHSLHCTSLMLLLLIKILRHLVKSVSFWSGVGIISTPCKKCKSGVLMKSDQQILHLIFSAHGHKPG